MKRKPLRLRPLLFSTLLGASILIVLVCALIFFHYNRPPSQTSEKNAVITGQYTFGALGPGLIAMEKDGVIKSALFATLISRIFSYDKRIHKGTYRFTSRLSTANILSLLSKGQEETILFTIIEGHDLYDIAFDLFEKKVITTPKDFITYAHSPTLLEYLQAQLMPLVESGAPVPALKSSEGFLYPNTYRLRLSRIREDLVTLAIDEFFMQNFPLLKEKNIPSQKWVSMMTIASLIEKETFVMAEKPLISSVIYNRQRAGMKLRYDPTIIYALKKADQYQNYLTDDGSFNIKKEHFTFQSPYNTYTTKKLPPTPISSFTRSSLAAALSPATTPYLFFVAKSRKDPSLGHDFSKSYAEHLEKIETYLKTKR